MNIIKTERLILRIWQKEDVMLYFNINQDPLIIEFLGESLLMQEVENFILRNNFQYEKK